MKKLRIVFAGTPAFGIPCLNALLGSDHQLIAVYTQPDRPAGRGRKEQASAIKEWALNHHIPIYQPNRLSNQDAETQLKALAPDVMVVIAYGLILPQNILDIPRFGCINVHASLLPRWRGASPIQHAILNGDKETGITIMQMDKGMDTGPILAKSSILLNSQTANELHDELSTLSCQPLLNVLQQLGTPSLSPIAQESALATYAAKLNKAQASINWHCTAKEIVRQIRAYNPWPIAYTNLNDLRIRIFDAIIVNNAINDTPGTITAFNSEGLFVATAEHSICIKKIQLPGGKVISTQDWLNAQNNPVKIGLKFSVTAS